MKYYQSLETKVLFNTKDIQAVYHKGLEMVQSIFYKHGTVNVNEVKVTVNKPCLLLIKNVSGSNPVIHLADPLQKEKVIELTIKTKRMEAVRTINIKMPEGQGAGSSCKIILENHQ